MKKKYLALALACVTLAVGACVLGGCSSSSSNTASNNTAANNTATNNATANTAANNTTSTSDYTLIVGFDQEYPPYGFVGDDGQYTGFDLDLATAVAEENGWKIKLEPIDWDAKDALLNSGAITCIWNGFTYEGRENDYTFSDLYMLNEQVIVVKKDSGITSESALSGKTVMTQVDSGALEVLEDEEGKAALAKTFASLQTISDYNNAFMQLDSGLVDAVACDLSIADYQMSANPDKYEIVTVLSEEHYAVGFKKGDTETAAAVNSALKKLDSAGKVKELCEKYASYGMDYSNWCLK